MRIGIISTFPLIECGIGTYTSYLVEKLRKLHNQVYIVSQLGERERRSTLRSMPRTATSPKRFLRP